MVEAEECHTNLTAEDPSMSRGSKKLQDTASPLGSPPAARVDATVGTDHAREDRQLEQSRLAYSKVCLRE